MYSNKCIKVCNTYHYVYIMYIYKCITNKCTKIIHKWNREKCGEKFWWHIRNFYYLHSAKHFAYYLVFATCWFITQWMHNFIYVNT